MAKCAPTPIFVVASALLALVTSRRGKPTMTIQALAPRAADHITRFARRNET